MVWKCLDEDGNASQPWTTNKTMNSDRYLEECLKKRLLPFIKKYIEFKMSAFGWT
jgi:hypothetical protein